MAKVIGIYNQKGGTGKTSSAINIAAFLEESGYDVLAIDIDVQGNYTDAMLHVENKTQLKTVVDLITNEEVEVKDTSYPVYLVMKSKSQPKRIHIDMIPAPQTETQKLFCDPLALQKTLDKVSKEYDYIIIDFPPERPYADTQKAEYNLVTLALCCANEIITPCTTDIDSINGFVTLTTHINLIKQMYNPYLYKTSFYINGFSGYKIEEEFLDSCKTLPSYSGICIPNSGLLKTSRAIERPLAWFNSKSQIAQSYKALTEYIK